LEHQIFRFAKMILRDRCSTLYDLECDDRGCLRTIIETIAIVHQDVMPAFTLVGPIRVVLQVIIPSAGGITPEKWRQDARVCASNWPTDYSFLLDGI
jgi:hypothetical protein